MLLIVALTWCMMGTVEGAAMEAGREGKLTERVGPMGALGRRKIPRHTEHPKSPVPVVVHPTGQAPSSAVGRAASQQLTRNQSSDPAREFWYLNPLLFLIRGLEILSVLSPWDCLLQGCLPQGGKDSKTLPSEDKPRLEDGLQLCLPSAAVTASPGEPAPSTAGACATAVTPRAGSNRSKNLPTMG